MRLRFLITGLLGFVSVCFAQNPAFFGDWTGNLELGGGKSLKLVLHVSEIPSVTLDSPDQGAYGLKCDIVYLENDSINIQLPALSLKYSGRLRDSSISGIFQQGFAKLPLTFTSGAKKAMRPQTPVPPFPYKEENISIANEAGGSVLAGTLTVPENMDTSTPVVVLISGSGQQNRDEEVFDHKPFAVIADYLARNGIASFRYDDRGFGESTGDPSAATTLDFASDAKSVLNWLRNLKRFNKIGLIGHSEGGTISYMLASGDDKADFIISIAGPSVDGAKIIEYQNKVALMDMGYSEAAATPLATEALKKLEDTPPNKWMEYFLKYDPAGDISKIEVPAFIIYGEKDCQVPPSLNYDTVRALVPKAIVKTYPGLNHLMQHARTGKVSEYSAIEETISPEVLADILSFIKKQ